MTGINVWKINAMAQWHRLMAFGASPIALSVSAGIISVMVIIWLVWSTWVSSEFAKDATTRSVNFERLAGEITYLDEVLTMSARMAASTGDQGWEERYRAHISILDAAVEKAIEEAGNAVAFAGAVQTHQANQNLIEMEERAFELVRKGRSKEAIVLLYSARYETQKALYAEGNKIFIGLLRNELASSLAADRRKVDASLIAAFVALIVVVGFWWLVAQHLRAQQRKIAAASRAKTEFLAAMSHELRTPLNAVVGFAEMMQLEPFGPLGSPEYREYVGDIRGAGQQLLALINDILDLSKVESGMEELKEEIIEITELTKTVHSLVRQRAVSGRLILAMDVPADLPMLSGDDHKLKQILTNLLTNAIKFTEPGGTVTLKVRCDDGKGHVFQVIDTGIGIAPDDIPKALSMFGQVDGGLGRQYEGTGLGLPLTKALIDLHGGSFDLQSKLGAGTTVTIGFPPERVLHLLRDVQTMRQDGQTAR